MGRRSTLGVATVVVAAAVLWMPAGSFGRSAAHGASRSRAVVVRHVGLGVSQQGMSKLTPEARALLMRAKRSSAGTRFVCFGVGATWSNTDAAQSCTIPGSLGVCIERSTNPDVVQTCTFTQKSTGRPNVAIAVQVIEQRDPVQGGAQTQNGKQVVDSSQGNKTGSNFNWTTQIIKQFLGSGSNNPDNEESQQQQTEAKAEAEGVPAQFGSLLQNLENTETAQESANPAALPAATLQSVSQTQTSQQTISVCQGFKDDCHVSVGMTGNNVNGNYQSLRQWEWASSAPSIDQQQNPAAGECQGSAFSRLNMCSLVSQNTTGGKNLSGVWELYRQFQRALHTLGGRQLQDPPFNGGLGHDISQTSDGLLGGPQREWIVTGQRARQVQRADDAGLLTQAQDPHVDKGPASFQVGSSADTWNGTLTADQWQLNSGLLSPPGTQQQELTYEGTSTGEIVATVRGTQNGNSASAYCPVAGLPGYCNARVSCLSGRCFIPSTST